ncbi:MAG: hypothetical protein L3K17_04245, partial [Thermoplasmata archaeon]|nr:hypothetical protein [Thermoplasmata archaeon]
FTSPHLLSYRERMQIDRRPISKTDVVAGVDRVEAIAGRLERSGRIDRAPTFFEVTTAVAFDWFRRRGVHDAVVEVGLGGRLDSTNVLDSAVGVITTIELEHTEILGPTLTDVAREKAGILHRGMAGVIGEAKDEPRTEIERRAAEAGVPLSHLGREIGFTDRTISPKGQRLTIHTSHRTLDGVEVPLFGSFQARNAAMAVGAAELYARATGQPLPDAAIRRGLSRIRWRARLERVARRPDLYVDVAHTPESAQALAESLGEIAPFESPEDNVIVFGCLADKPAATILRTLEPLAHTIVIVPVRSERSASPDDLRRAALGRFRRIVVAPDAAQGLALARGATAPKGFTVVTGSDYLAGEVLRLQEGAPEDEPDLSDPGRTLTAEPHAEGAGP